ncbi:MAG: hypothetical protein ACYDDF_13040 [Thermoplasmatota archaeon]
MRSAMVRATERVMSAPVAGVSAVELQLPTRVALRLAMQCMVEGRSAEEIVAAALAAYWPQASS